MIILWAILIREFKRIREGWLLSMYSTPSTQVMFFWGVENGDANEGSEVGWDGCRVELDEKMKLKWEMSHPLLKLDQAFNFSRLSDFLDHPCSLRLRAVMDVWYTQDSNLSSFSRWYRSGGSWISSIHALPSKLISWVSAWQTDTVPTLRPTPDQEIVLNA